MRCLWSVALLTILAGVGPALAQSNDALKIGVMADSGPYADIQGKGSVEAVRMAVEDAGGQVKGRKVEVLSKDPQQKTDLASTIARQWFDEGVDVVMDPPGSNLSLAVQEIAKSRDKIVFNITSGSPAITGKFCTRTSFHWNMNNYVTARVLASNMIKAGFDTWFIIAVNNAGGKAGAEGVSSAVAALGGKVLGTVFHPGDTVDYSSFVLQAQSSGAKVVAIANSGENTINTIKAVNEYGLNKTARLAIPTFYVTDAHAVGMDIGKGLQFVDTFYWNDDPEAAAWGQRFFKRTGKMPSSIQAAAYTAAKFYLEAAAKVADPKNGAAVSDEMRKTVINDFMTKNGSIRPDGFVLRKRALYEIRPAGESKSEWDLLKKVKDIEAVEGTIALADTGCPLLGK